MKNHGWPKGVHPDKCLGCWLGALKAKAKRMVGKKIVKVTAKRYKN